MRFSQFISLAVTLIVTGCTYHMDYQTKAVPKFSDGNKSEPIAVVGIDEREYLKNKEIKSQYVGLFRDELFAIPYHWVTRSGNPVADDLAINLAKGLNEAGYKAESISNPNPGSMEAGLAAAQKANAQKILMIKVNTLESDTQWRTELGYDFTFELLTPSGKLLASNRINGSHMIGASALPTMTARNTVPKKVGELISEGVKPLLKDL